ncbi:centrosomal protein of 295 kDa isoform X2 [Hyla sarda]|uniref:centrosomal protein of 295 kDa isoform X2 n=1 Tax=Hyla sarda TaxID=327740 RepID=UPI0024C34BC6|nr:centrosomal protein of 295 kDa isoform X2 [Hyla sarda]
MKRKVAKVSTLRASPNEEASVLKQERERRRKLRLQQVREQEKFIAQQIRRDVKERKDQQLQQLAEDLRAKWEAAQAEKIQALEKIYLCTLNAIGEGHRQAKENEPDLKAIEKAAATNKEKAEKRHREALKELKQHRERQLRTQSWHIKARNKALEVERERAAKIASLPPPPPDPIQNIEVAKSLPLVKVCNVDSFSSSHYHLPEAYVDREIDTEQTDARTAAEEEEKRLNMLQQEEERERREQMEKASLRGSHALKMVQLAQDRDRLMKELEQMQQEDLSRRRQIVAKMPQQLFEPVYRRTEIREEWQRDLETAFEDMYTRNAKMRGDMVLHLKPQPLPDPSVTSVDEDLDLTVVPEAASGEKPHLGVHEDISSVEQQEIREPQSKQVLKRLLNRIRTQKDQWSAKAETADTVSDTLESGSLPVNKESEDGIQEEEDKSVIVSNEVTDSTVLAGKSILLHPQEQAVRIRAEAVRKKKMEELERQKQEQLELIRKLEEERKTLEAEFQKMRQQVQDGEQESSFTVQKEGHEPALIDDAPQESAVAQLNTSAESLHIQMIREYQQRLIEQNRIHKQSVDEARKHLQEYQLLLKNRYPHLSTSNIGSQDQGQENTRNLQGPQISLSERSILSSLPGPSLSTEKEKSGQSMSQDLVKTQQTSPRNNVPLKQKLESVPSSASDFLAVDPSKVRIDSPVSVVLPSHPPFLGRSPPHGLLSHSPNEDRVRSQDTIIGLEKLSSMSSPGEHDSSSSTSYFPLPSALTLGLPPVDFSEPSISFSDPEEQMCKKDPVSLGDFSNVQEFRERLLSSAAEIRNQQDHLKEMQTLLDKQRESLLSNQKNQEHHLLHKQKELEDQIRRHQGSLEKLLDSTEPRQGAVPADLHLMPERERYQFMSILLKALNDDEEEDSGVTNFLSSNGSLVKPSGREQKWRPSKPPVTKTKLGPFLQQHELSAIMEVETPNSGRHSSTGYSELGESQKGQNDRSGHGELVGYHPDISRRSSDSTLIQGDLSRLSTSIRDETPDQSRPKLSWRETLSLQGSNDPTGADHSFTPVLYKSLHWSLSSNTFPKHLSMGEGASGLVPTGQGRSPDSACDYLSTTTISSGSFLTSEKADSSPAHSDVPSELQRCNYSAIKDQKVSSSSPSAATAGIHHGTWSDYFGAVENRSHIQQIIEKYTKDLSASLERNLSFHSPEAATDISAPDNHLSSTFHSLDPKPDSNISTPSYAHSERTCSPQSTQEGSQSSSNTSRPDQQSCRGPESYLPPSMLALSSSIGLFHSQNMGRISPRRQNEAGLVDDSSGSFLPLHPESTLNEPSVSSHEDPACAVSNENLPESSSNTSRPDQQSCRGPESYLPPSMLALSSSIGLFHSQNMGRISPRRQNEAGLVHDSSGSFLPLHPESTLNEPNVSSHEDPACAVSGPEQYDENPLRPGVLQSVDACYMHDTGHRALSSQHSSAILTSAVEERTSFRELMAAQMTVNDSQLSEHPISESLERNSVKNVHLEERCAVQEVTSDTDRVAPCDTDGGFHRAASQSSDQTPENMTHTSHSRSSLSSLSSLTIGSSAGSLPSFVRTWDSESMRGILEEPDLTLISLNDSSIACSEPPATPTAEHHDRNTSQSSFHPLHPEVDASSLHGPDQSSVGSTLSQHFAEMSLEFTSTPGSLQDAFLRKKKHFIDNSAKRVQGIKNKDRVPKKGSCDLSDVLANQDDQQSSSELSQCDGTQLKKVLEVRVSTPEDRKLSEVEMHQRTLRLYNQLDEVKMRREEKMRQESYTKNREKAKEFKKRTLEKLRGKK